MKDRLEIAMQAVLAAGEVVKMYYRGSFELSTKRNYRDLLTSTDLASEKTIIDVIRTSFPQDKILSEETEKCDIHEDSLWVIDPIDGTSNFAAGLPLHCVSIAYVEQSVSTVGVVYNTLTGDIFSAQKGQGAYLTVGEKKVKISVTDTTDLKNALVSFDYSSIDEYRQEMREVTSTLPPLVRGIRIIGATALELSWVGAGFLDAYISRGSHPWDVAAGAMIVEESGGKVTDWQGNPWTLESGQYLATNGKLHDEVLNKIFSKS